MAKLNISVQLYTLRDATSADLPGVLKALKKIGYAGAELAGFGNLKTAAEVRKAFDDAGLKVSGAHIGIDQFETDIDRVIEDSKILGNENVIVPYLGEDRRKSGEDYRKLAHELNGFGKKVAEAGLTLSYHNHAFEFEKFDGQYALDILWQHSDPNLVKAELDLYWVKRGGVDPVAYVKQLGKRCVLVHLKDMEAGPDQKFAPVGTGTLDFEALSETCAEVGVQWGAVEQDNCYGADPLKNVEISFNNLKKLGIA